MSIDGGLFAFIFAIFLLYVRYWDAPLDLLRCMFLSYFVLQNNQNMKDIRMFYYTLNSFCCVSWIIHVCPYIKSYETYHYSRAELFKHGRRQLCRNHNENDLKALSESIVHFRRHYKHAFNTRANINCIMGERNGVHSHHTIASPRNRALCSNNNKDDSNNNENNKMEWNKSAEERVWSNKA